MQIPNQRSLLQYIDDRVLQIFSNDKGQDSKKLFAKCAITQEKQGFQNVEHIEWIKPTDSRYDSLFYGTHTVNQYGQTVRPPNKIVERQAHHTVGSIKRYITAETSEVDLSLTLVWARAAKLNQQGDMSMTLNLENKHHN